MYLFGQDSAKVGIVNVVKRRGSYKLRFYYPAGNRHEIAIAEITPEGWQQAIRAAQLIDRDCSLNDFDDTYARYSPRHARKLKGVGELRYDLKVRRSLRGRMTCKRNWNVPESKIMN